MRAQPIVLGAQEPVPDHDFASSRHYPSDIALLNYLLQDLRVLARRCAKGELDLQPHQVVTWHVHGLERRTVTCDPARLCAHDDVHIVGFFGDRRDPSDQATIDRNDADLIAQFPDHDGLISYSSIELVDHYWANLVVHAAPEDREKWRSCPQHIAAVEEVAPKAFHSVRIHNGCIRRGVLGPETVVVESTKYWDYDTTPTWHAARFLPGGESEITQGPASETRSTNQEEYR